MKIFFIILIVCLSILVLGFIISEIIVVKLVFDAFFVTLNKDKLEKTNMTNDHYQAIKDEIYSCTDELLKREHTIHTINSFDNLKLKSEYYSCGSKKLVIMFHGVHAIAHYNFAYLALKLLDKGYDVCIVYQRAHLESEGKYITYGNFEQHDVMSWVKYFEDFDNIEDIYLYGISMGGTSIALASDQLESKKTKALFIDCAFTSIKDLIDHLVKSRNLPRILFVPYMKAIYRLKFKKKFDSDKTYEHLKKAKYPCMFIEGESDDVVPKEFVLLNYESCTSPKELYLVPEAGHTTASIIGEDEALDRIINFMEKYREVLK